MSKLEKITTSYNATVSAFDAILLQALNAAIDKINELEARYEGHRHNVNVTGWPVTKVSQFESATTAPIPEESK